MPSVLGKRYGSGGTTSVQLAADGILYFFFFFFFFFVILCKFQVHYKIVLMSGILTHILVYSGQSTSRGKKVSHVRPTYADKLPYTFNFDAEIRGKALSKVTTGNKTDKIKVIDNKKDAVAKVCYLAKINVI